MKRKSSLFSVGDTHAELGVLSAESDTWLEPAEDIASSAPTTTDTTLSRNAVVYIAVAFLSVIFIIFSGKLFAMQALDGDRYRQLANGNRVREVVEYAERGTIYDRNGKVLADSVAGYQVRVSPHQLPREEAPRRKLYQDVAAYLSLPANTIEQRAEYSGLNYALPIAIGAPLDHQTSIEFEQEFQGVSGVSIDVVPRRNYHHGDGVSTILGYTSLVNASDLAAREGLMFIDYIGRSGIEEQYDEVLRGENGYQRYEVDAQGNPIRLIASKAAIPGQDMYLSIDLDIQKQLAESVARQANAAPSKKGSGVVVEPTNGEILAMVSYPWYDNNQFARGISTDQYQALISDPLQPLFNKAISGGYPSGSVIKPLVAASALAERVVDDETVIVDNGFITIGNPYSGRSARFDGWRLSGLGPMTARRAIAMSSNIYFYTVGGGHGGIEGLGIERLAEHYRDFGLGEPTGVDLPSEGSGLVPDEAWKKENLGVGWYRGDTYNLSIGQGDLKVSPLQMIMAHAAIANGGDLLAPRLLRQVEGEAVRQPQVRRRIDVSSEHIKVVQEGMYEMTHNGSTCSCMFDNINTETAGKTGTAQADSTGDKPHHGWYMTYAPYESPELAVGVMIENGGGGTQAAVPVAVDVLERYFGTVTVVETNENLSDN